MSDPAGHAVTAAALRQRRSRAHRKGDHSLCLEGSCGRAGESPAALEDAVSAVPEPEPDEWGPSGAQLWRELSDAVPGSYRLLLREACRIVDRLDRIHGVLEGRRDWVRISTLDFGENVKVRITLDGVLAEARQQETTVLALVKELQAAAVKAKQSAPKAGGGLGDLSARIAARRSASAG